MSAAVYQPPTLAALMALPEVGRKQALIDWLRSQPPETTYQPMDTGDCALSRFSAAVGGDGSGDCDSIWEAHGVPRLHILPKPPLWGFTCIMKGGSYPPIRTYAELIAALEAHVSTP